MNIVKKGAWDAYKLLASTATLGEVKGLIPKHRLVVASMHHFGGKGAFSV